MNPIITTQGLTRRFGEKTAVDGLTLEVAAGEIFGVLGHNGAGKTTTVRLLNGVLAADGGTMHVLGMNPAEHGAKIRAQTGVLTETPSLDERLTGRDNLLIYADLYNVPKAQINPRIDILLALFELADRQHEKAGGYSKGMKQRLALCRALVHEPPILFLDEPTSGLDPVSSRHVQDLIRRLSRQEGRTVFLCTHNLTEAQQICDRMAILEQGKLLAIGTLHEIAEKSGLKTRFKIELTTEAVPHAADVLGQFPQISVTPNGNSLEVNGATREQIPDLLTALFHQHIKFYSVIPQEASLEDIYFTLHGETPA